jgi:hypothetical protein
VRHFFTDSHRTPYAIDRIVRMKPEQQGIGTRE